jgi:hypothetical protein
VCNGLDHAVEFVEITANLYSSSNVLLATSFGFACVTTMPGNSDSDYTVLVSSPPLGVDHVTVGVTNYSDPAYDPPIIGLNPAITNVYTDGIGYRHAVGTVTNGSSNTYKFVQPCVAFYDSSGDVIRTDFTFASPDTLAPGASGTFDAFVDDPGGLVTQRIWVDAQYGP